MNTRTIIRWGLGVVTVGACLMIGMSLFGAPPEANKDVAKWGREIVPGLPEPGLPPPEQVTMVFPATFQLVGHTEQLLPANRGVLNMTTACQREFPGSRLCTVDEVMDSLIVPAVAPECESSYAWVRSAGTAASSLLDLGEKMDCRGWTSTVSREHGVAMTLGSESTCNGGFEMVSCDSVLAVACCAMMQPAS